MIDDTDDLSVRRAAHRLPAHRLPAAQRFGEPDRYHPRGARVTAASTARLSARWADDFAGMLRVEIRAAEQHGVISVGEGEQLLARLVVILDQAVAPSCAP
ncbi:hypothetical protein [Pseudonocardia broussonetiae]|uniref:Uncharacterized protein n=1 Tax=Pseudonocardia broussonetiae TaxID=2736640 RepID=A0A6M6JM58_9PSEU|nr:hypothetical protein [Pseudonocardia broussonetiae]QJY49184.1 hypothetical protein HOP40_28355 [Pseudonocardia broussonetiae]